MKPIHTMTIAAILWGFHGVPVALSHASSGYISITRFLLSSIFLLTFYFFSKEKFSLSPVLNYVSILSALFWALTSILFVCAIAVKGGSVISTVALSYCFPVFTITFKYIKTGQLSRRDFSAAILILYGVYCFLPEVNSIAYYSSTLAILSGLSLSLHLECATRAESSNGIILSILVGHLAGIVLTSLILIDSRAVLEEFFTLSMDQHCWILTLGVLTGVTYLLYAYAAPVLDETVTSVVLLLELVIATYAGFYFLSEAFDGFKVAGTLSMLCALSCRLLEPIPILQRQSKRNSQ